MDAKYAGWGLPALEVGAAGGADESPAGAVGGEAVRWDPVELPTGELVGYLPRERLAPRRAFLGALPVVLAGNPPPDEEESYVGYVVLARTAGYSVAVDWRAGARGIRKLPREATPREKRACAAFLREGTPGDYLTAIETRSCDARDIALWVHELGDPDRPDVRHTILNREGARK